MSLKMVQKFCFETDDLEHLESMLKTIIPLSFSPNGNFSRLHVHTKEKDAHWDDGRYDDWHSDMPSLFEIGKVAKDFKGGGVWLLKHDRTYGGATLLVEDGHAKTLDFAAQMACSREIPPKPKRMFIAFLDDYKEEKSEPDTIKCKDYADMLQWAICQVHMAKDERQQEFLDKCGDGYSDGFNSFDGTVEHGYRVHYEPAGGPGRLVLSMVHIYYGK